MSKKYSINLAKLAEKDPAAAKMLQGQADVTLELSGISEIPDDEMDSVAGGAINIYICFFGCKFHRSVDDDVMELTPQRVISEQDYQNLLNGGYVLESGYLLEGGYLQPVG